MQILSDIIQKEHVLITVNAKTTSFEILRAILLYKELEAKSLKPVFYVHGAPTAFLYAALNAENIPIQKQVVRETPFVIEIRKGSSKIKSVKVDKVGDKLKLFLIPNKGMLPRDLVDIVGVNLPYSHIIGFGQPDYLDELFEGVSYEKISAIKEYGRSEFSTISLDDFADIIARANQMSLSGYVKKLVDLNVYNDFIEFFLTGEGNVDLLKVREALINNVLSWGRKDYVQALANWHREDDFIVGIVRVGESNFVPSMPMWADFVFLAESGIRYPVVTLIQFGKYLYTRIVSPVALPTELQTVGFWTKEHLAEGLIVVDKVEEWKNKIIALLKKAGIKPKEVDVVSETSNVVLNSSETAYEALKKFNTDSVGDNIKSGGTVVWSQNDSDTSELQIRHGKRNLKESVKNIQPMKDSATVSVTTVQTSASKKNVSGMQETTGRNETNLREKTVSDNNEEGTENNLFNGVKVQVSDEPLELGDVVAKLAASANNGNQTGASKKDSPEVSQKLEGYILRQGGQNSLAVTENTESNKSFTATQPTAVKQGASDEGNKELDNELEELAAKIRKTLDL